MISKEKIFFDPTDANTVADSDSVGAFVRAGSDGDLIASQTINSEEWLNTASSIFDESGAAITSANPFPVYVEGGVNLEVDLSHVDDSVRLGDGTSFFTSTSENSDIALDVHISNSSIAVTATDLDIRDLAFATDSVDVSGSEVSLDAATLAALETITVLQGTSPWVIGDGGGSITVDGTVAVTQSTSPWVVSATDLDIRDIVNTQDSIAIGDATSLFTATTVGADYALDVNVVQAVDPSTANTAIKTTAKSTTSTQSALLAAQLAARKFMMVQNLGNRSVFVAEAGAADAATTGLRLSPGAVGEFKIGPSVSLDIEASGGTQDVRVLEAS